MFITNHANGFLVDCQFQRAISVRVLFAVLFVDLEPASFQKKSSLEINLYIGS